MTRLRPLLKDEIADYVPRLTMTYAAELTEHLFLTAEAAAARAARSATDAFPAGEAGAGHWLYAVEDGEGPRGGVLWLGDQFDGEPDSLWVYDIEIDPEHRGRGLGLSRQAGQQRTTSVHAPRLVAASVGPGERA